MVQPNLTLMLLALALIGSDTALAQPPGSFPHLSPPYGPPLTLSQAKALAAQAEAEAAKRGTDTMVVAVVQPSGELIFLEKLDGATNIAVEFAEAKARTAAVSRVATAPFPPGMGAPLPSVVGLPGGVPVIINGRTAGAIGIGGVDGGDAAIAQAAAAALR